MLRQELKKIRDALSDLESAMGFHRRNQKMSTVEILRLIASQTKNAQMEREVEERRQLSALQTFELQRMRNELCVSECDKVVRWCPYGDSLAIFCVLYFQRASRSTFQNCILNSH